MENFNEYNKDERQQEDATNEPPAEENAGEVTFEPIEEPAVADGAVAPDAAESGDTTGAMEVSEVTEENAALSDEAPAEETSTEDVSVEEVTAEEMPAEEAPSEITEETAAEPEATADEPPPVPETGKSKVKVKSTAERFVDKGGKRMSPKTAKIIKLSFILGLPILAIVFGTLLVLKLTETPKVKTKTISDEDIIKEAKKIHLDAMTMFTKDVASVRDLPENLDAVKALRTIADQVLERVDEALKKIQEVRAHYPSETNLTWDTDIANMQKDRIAVTRKRNELDGHIKYKEGQAKPSEEQPQDPVAANPPPKPSDIPIIDSGEKGPKTPEPPAEPVKPESPAEPSKPETPETPAEPAKPETPPEPAKPETPETPAEPVEPPKPETPPAEPPAEPVKPETPPAEPPETAKPETPAEPPKPETPETPAEPAKPETPPAEPVEPPKPETPPAEPPAEPVKPETPPAEPPEPAKPETPAEPVEPPKPETPETPPEPAQPETPPAEPIDPAKPETPPIEPVNPEPPGEPVKPETPPVEPAKPENPVGAVPPVPEPAKEPVKAPVEPVIKPEDFILDDAHNSVIQASKVFVGVIDKAIKPPMDEASAEFKKEEVINVIKSLRTLHKQLNKASDNYKKLREKNPSAEYVYLDDYVRRIDTINKFVDERMKILKTIVKDVEIPPDPVEEKEATPEQPKEVAEKPPEQPKADEKPPEAEKPAEPTPEQPVAPAPESGPTPIDGAWVMDTDATVAELQNNAAFKDSVVARQAQETTIKATEITFDFISDRAWVGTSSELVAGEKMTRTRKGTFTFNNDKFTLKATKEDDRTLEPPKVIEGILTDGKLMIPITELNATVVLKRKE